MGKAGKLFWSECEPGERPRYVKPVVYFIEAVGLDLVKIGYTEELLRRFKQIRTSCPVAIQLVGFVHGDQSLEAQFHREYKAYRAEGEWFRISQEALDSLRTEMDDWDVIRDFWCTCDITNDQIPWRPRADKNVALMDDLSSNFSRFMEETTNV